MAKRSGQKSPNLENQGWSKRSFPQQPQADESIDPEFSV
jgi:hypothetical protein